MKKLLLKNSIAAIFFLAISCGQTEENDLTKTINENDIAKMLVFKKSDASLNSTNKRKTLTIVSWDEWGRASRECDGWGLCYANWFYCTDDTTHEQVPCSGKNGNGYSAPIEYDDITNQYSFDILLGEVPTIDSELLVLKVENNIELNTSLSSEIGKDLTIPIGNYHYDSEIGEFGGYRIVLQ